jgi:hypothetical protein
VGGGAGGPARGREPTVPYPAGRGGRVRRHPRCSGPGRPGRAGLPSAGASPCPARCGPMGRQAYPRTPTSVRPRHPDPGPLTATPPARRPPSPATASQRSTGDWGCGNARTLPRDAGNGCSGLVPAGLRHGVAPVHLPLSSADGGGDANGGTVAMVAGRRWWQSAAHMMGGLGGANVARQR